MSLSGRFFKDASIPAAKLGGDVIGGDGKLVAGVIPASLFGAMKYKDNWDATTNTPAIPAAAAGNEGWVYIVSVAGMVTLGATVSTGGATEVNPGDYIWSNGSTWLLTDNTEKAQLASTTAYNNATSGLDATTAQGAIDETVVRAATAQTAADAAGIKATVTLVTVRYAVISVGLQHMSDAINAYTVGSTVDGRMIGVGDNLVIMASDMVAGIARGDIYTVQASGDPIKTSAMSTGTRMVEILNTAINAPGSFGASGVVTFHLPAVGGTITMQRTVSNAAVATVAANLSTYVADHYVDDETLTGAVDGTNKVFATAYPPQTGTVPRLEIDYFRQGVPTAATWDAATHSFTFVSAPLVGERVSGTYFSSPVVRKKEEASAPVL